ncbi:MAG: PAS domain S-box protein [Algoriphagus sp.]|nr:PAS domain S-box protein [Algoriphagus sp.]
MKISLEKKIFFGFIINVMVVITSGLIFIFRLDQERDKTMDASLNWIELSLFGLSIILLIIVYFIIRYQLRARQVAQTLLFENKQLLQSIIDNTSNPIFIKKLNGEYLLVNKDFGAVFQTPNEEIIGKTDSDFLSQQVAEMFRNSEAEVIKKLREVKTEETIEQEDGKHTYLAVKFPLYDSTGRIYAIGGISTDITERKKLEESLASSDKFFNMSTEMMLIATSDKFIKVNPATIKILGYTEEELLSQPFLNFVYPEDKNHTSREVVKLKTGAITMQFKNRYICKDGSLKWLQWFTSPDVSTGLLYAVAQDITALVNLENEQQKAIEELYENEEKLRLIVENIGEGVIVTNADKKVVLANDMAHEIFGIEEDDKISTDLTDHFHLYYPDGKNTFPSQNLPMERAFNGEVTDDVDIVIWNPTTLQKRRVLISGRPLIDQDNHVVAAVITIKDISNYKKLEEDLKESENKYRQLIGFRKGGK